MRTPLILAALVALSPACKKKSKGAEEDKKPVAGKPVVAQDAAATAVKAAPKKKAMENPLLWKITPASGATAKPTYLFGTFHASITVDDIPESVWKALDGSPSFVMEADQTKMDQGVLMKLMMLPPERSLDKELPADKWKKVLELTKLPPDGLKKMQPWFVALTIGLKFFDVGVPIDMQMRARAQQHGNRVEFLESWRAALDVLATASTTKDLIELVDDIDKARKLAKDLLAAYREGSVDKLIAATFDAEEMKKQPKVYEGLFFGRNRAWMPKVEAYAKAGGAFIAVGAGHLVGKKGLLDLLAAKGYKTERIK